MKTPAWKIILLPLLPAVIYTLLRYVVWILYLLKFSDAPRVLGKFIYSIDSFVAVIFSGAFYFQAEKIAYFIDPLSWLQLAFSGLGYQFFVPTISPLLLLYLLFVTPLIIRKLGKDGYFNVAARSAWVYLIGVGALISINIVLTSYPIAKFGVTHILERIFLPFLGLSERPEELGAAMLLILLVLCAGWSVRELSRLRKLSRGSVAVAPESSNRAFPKFISSVSRNVFLPAISFLLIAQFTMLVVLRVFVGRRYPFLIHCEELSCVELWITFEAMVVISTVVYVAIRRILSHKVKIIILVSLLLIFVSAVIAQDLRLRAINKKALLREQQFKEELTRRPDLILEFTSKPKTSTTGNPTQLSFKILNRGGKPAFFGDGGGIPWKFESDYKGAVVKTISDECRAINSLEPNQGCNVALEVTFYLPGDKNGYIVVDPDSTTENVAKPNSYPTYPFRFEGSPLENPVSQVPVEPKSPFKPETENLKTLPDFVLESVVFPTSAKAGQATRFSFKLLNKGGDYSLKDYGYFIVPMSFTLGDDYDVVKNDCETTQNFPSGSGCLMIFDVHFSKAGKQTVWFRINGGKEIPEISAENNLFTRDVNVISY